MILSTKHDWDKIRTAYITECPKPSYDELSDRFNVPSGTLGRVASSESWPQLRLAALQKSEQTADALEIIRQAASEASVTADMGVSVCQAIFEAGANLAAELIKNEAGLSLRARSDILNTIGFATQNAANAAARLGVFSVPGLAKRSANAVEGALDGHGKWNPGLLQQINVTVQGMKPNETPAVDVSGSEPAEK